MTEDLTYYLKRVREIDEQLLKLGEKTLLADNRKLFPMDLLFAAAIKRTHSLNIAFLDLIEKDDFLTAVHLIRLQLDTALRLSAAWIVPDCQKFANEVLEGKEIRNLKDRDGKKLTDWYLVDVLSKKEKWIKELYDNTCGFIHLSIKHISNVVSFSEKENEFDICLSDKGERIDLDSKISAVQSIGSITAMIYHYTNGWYHTKEMGSNKVVEKNSEPLRSQNPSR